MKNKYALLIIIITILSFDSLISAVRIKDVAYVKGVRKQQLIGYGLVVGLNGTGDTHRSTFTFQSIASMLKRFGITVSQDDLRLRNVAAVMVTATIPGFAKEGSVNDVSVSSLGDATSLQGGTLLFTPLSGIEGTVYATAQGQVSVGGTIVTASGNEVRRNHTAAGRIPGGAIMDKPFRSDNKRDSLVTIILTQADFTTAHRIAEAINIQFSQSIAIANDASSVSISLAPEWREDGKLVEFISSVELIEVNPDVIARVVINEKTGTVIIGKNVAILPVAISHAGINIEIQSTPVVSQPQSFSKGETTVTNVTSIYTGVDSSQVMAIDGAATVQDIARSLNTLKVTPRDIISIFQALKEAGALKAELTII